MQRRTFFTLSSLAFAGSFLPLTSCFGPDTSLQRRLSIPVMMASINDSLTIIEVGQSYLERTPDENNPKELIDRLMIDSNGKNISKNTDSLTLNEMMLQKIKTDYENREIIIVNGWVLSLTEARQCALYSLTILN